MHCYHSVIIKVYSDTVVEKGVLGTKRHYWVQPRPQDRAVKLGKLPNIQPGKRRWNKEIAYFNAVKTYGENGRG